MVVAPLEQHVQTFTGPADDHSLTGAVRAPVWGLPPLRMDARRVIAHRTMLEIDRMHAIVNLGVGMPEVHPHPCLPAAGVVHPHVPACTAFLPASS